MNFLPIGGEVGPASAVKMSYTSGTRVTTAFLTARLVTAEGLRLFEVLQSELLHSRAANCQHAAASTGRLTRSTTRNVVRVYRSLPTRRASRRSASGCASHPSTL